MPHTLTITGVTGPGKAVTALPLTGVLALHFDMVANKLQIDMPASGENKTKEIDLVGITSIACTITAGVQAWVIS